MRVFMTGLIYLNGCTEAEKRAYAPQATGHHASLWVEAAQLDDIATEWWSGSRRATRGIDGVEIIEFVIPARATISFPVTAGDVTCDDLDHKLPKLKKKKQGQPDEDFAVD